MKNQKLSLIAFLGITIALASCSDDEKKISADKAKAEISSVNTQLASDVSTFSSSDGYVAMNYLSTLTDASNPFGRVTVKAKPEDARAYIREGVSGLRKTLVRSSATGRVSGDEPFDYNANKGVYVWNGDVFERTGNSDIIEIQFPSSAESVNNDATFKLTAYSEVLTENGDDLYSPTSIKAAIYFGATKKAELNLTAEYDATTSDVIFADVFYFVDPFSVNVTLNDKKAKSSSFTESLSANGEVLIAVGLSASYYTEDKSEENIKSAEAFLQLKKVRFTMVTVSNANATDINDIVKITIKVNGALAGKVLIVEDAATGEFNLVVRFNDGSEEDLDTLFGDLSLELGDFGVL